MANDGSVSVVKFADINEDEPFPKPRVDRITVSGKEVLPSNTRFVAVPPNRVNPNLYSASDRGEPNSDKEIHDSQSIFNSQKSSRLA